MAEPLTNIINASLKQGKYPKIWREKKCGLTPVPKGKTNQTLNQTLKELKPDTNRTKRIGTEHHVGMTKLFPLNTHNIRNREQFKVNKASTVSYINSTIPYFQRKLNDYYNKLAEAKQHGPAFYYFTIWAYDDFLFSYLCV